MGSAGRWASLPGCSTDAGWRRFSWSRALLFSSGIHRTTSRAAMCSFFFREANAVNGTSATSAVETHRFVSSSKIAFVYSLAPNAPSVMASRTSRFVPRGVPVGPRRSSRARTVGAVVLDCGRHNYPDKTGILGLMHLQILNQIGGSRLIDRVTAPVELVPVCSRRARPIVVNASRAIV